MPKISMPNFCQATGKRLASVVSSWGGGDLRGQTFKIEIIHIMKLSPQNNFGELNRILRDW